MLGCSGGVEWNPGMSMRGDVEEIGEGGRGGVRLLRRNIDAGATTGEVEKNDEYAGAG